MANFKKVSPREPFTFSAEFYNALVDMVNRGTATPPASGQPSSTSLKPGDVADVFVGGETTGLGGGYYRGVYLVSNSRVWDVTTSVPLSLPTGANLPCLIANKAEGNKTTHVLTSTASSSYEPKTLYPGIFIGWGTDPTYGTTLPLFSIWALRLKNC